MHKQVSILADRKYFKSTKEKSESWKNILELKNSIEVFNNRQDQIVEHIQSEEQREKKMKTSEDSLRYL